MKLSEMLNKDQIILDFKADDKADIIRLLVDNLQGVDKDGLLEQLLEREELGSTGIGEGVAVPHVRLDSVDELHVVFGRPQKPVDYDAIDEEPCSFFFLVIGSDAPDGRQNYLQLMAKISRLMRNQSARDGIQSAPSGEEVLAVIADNEK